MLCYTYSFKWLGWITCIFIFIFLFFICKWSHHLLRGCSITELVNFVLHWVTSPLSLFILIGNSKAHREHLATHLLSFCSSNLYWPWPHKKSLIHAFWSTAYPGFLHLCEFERGGGRAVSRWLVPILNHRHFTQQGPPYCRDLTNTYRIEMK